MAMRARLREIENSRLSELTPSKIGGGQRQEKMNEYLAIALRSGHGSFEEIQRLVENGSDVNAIVMGRPILNWMFEEKSRNLAYGPKSWKSEDTSAVLSYLLKKGADPNARSEGAGETPMMLAAALNDVESMKILAAAGADIKLVDSVGKNMLHYAAEGGLEAVKYLVSLPESGVAINLTNNFLETPLFGALAFRNDDAVKFLIEHGADVNMLTTEGRSSLMLGVVKGCGKDTIRMILERTEDINLQDKYMATALHYATYYGNAAAVGMLLSAGADTGIKDDHDGTPIFGIVRIDKNMMEKSHIKLEDMVHIAKSLIEAGADLQVVSQKGNLLEVGKEFGGAKEVLDVIAKAQGQ